MGALRYYKVLLGIIYFSQIKFHDIVNDYLELEIQSPKLQLFVWKSTNSHFILSSTASEGSLTEIPGRSPGGTPAKNPGEIASIIYGSIPSRIPERFPITIWTGALEKKTTTPREVAVIRTKE